MNDRKNSTLDEFCGALKKANNFLLASHVNPEGDAIGSVIAMESFLKRLGKRTIIVCEDPFPERLSCLPHQDRWNILKNVKAKGGQFDALVVADCPTLARIGKVKELLTPNTVIFNIDHHISNDLFGCYNYVLPKAAACGEVIYEIIKKFKMPLTREEAVALYVSLSTDTGSFKYSNTSVMSHKIAAELIQTGIDIERINEDLYATYSLNKISLYSRLLGKVETAFGGRVAWVSMSRRDLLDSKATYEDTEGFIDFLKYIKEVKVAFFISEMEKPNEVKVSFRSKEKYDVNQIATVFGGGGHKKASGCTINKGPQAAVQAILKEIEKQFRFDQTENKNG